jgi:hypothetical protein
MHQKVNLREFILSRLKIENGEVVIYSTVSGYLGTFQVEDESGLEDLQDMLENVIFGLLSDLRVVKSDSSLKA